MGYQNKQKTKRFWKSTTPLEMQEISRAILFDS